MADGPSTPNAVRQPRPQSPVVAGKNNDAENVGQLNTRLERYLIKVRDLAKQNEDLKAKLAKLKGTKNPGAFNATDELKGKLDALAAEKKELEGALSDLDKKNGDKKRAVDLLKRENEGNAEELAQKEKDILALNQAIGHLQDRPKVADPQRFNEIALLKEKIKEKEAEIKKMKENAQEDFEKALENEKLIWKTHEDDVKKELADHYSKKTKELDDKIQKLRDQLELLKKAKGQEQATLNSLNDRLERLRRERAGLILELDKKKDDTLNKIKVAVAERADEVEVLKRLAREKEQDLHGHERQNVEFKDEIRKYEEILEAEEKRYSLDSHSKKRKIEDVAPAVPALVPTPAPAPAVSKNPAAAAAGARAPLPTTAPVFFSPNPSRTAIQPDAGEQGSQDVGSVSFKVSKSGRVQIKEISSVSLKIYNLTKDDIDMSGWFIQAVPSANPTKPQKFKFPEDEQLPSEGTLIVKVASEEKNEPFDGSQYGPGSYIQILDKEDILVSQVEISHDGQPGDKRNNCVSM